MRPSSARIFATLFVAACGAPAWSQMTVRVSESKTGAQSNGGSHIPSISSDGRFVAFESAASNLVAGDTNGKADAFVRDLQTGAMERVSVNSSGAQGNGDSHSVWISASGRFVVFESLATNLVLPPKTGWKILLHDRLLHSTELVSVDSSGTPANGECHRPSVSADGQRVAFWSTADDLVPGDSNQSADVFVRDRQAGTTVLASVDSSGVQGDASSAEFPAICADGRYVVFDSRATNLVPGDTNGQSDIFVRDLLLGLTERVSVSSSGTQGDGMSFDISSISADGRFVAFVSDADDLVPGDTNQVIDVFLRDRLLGTTERVSLGAGGVQADADSEFPSLSDDGRTVAFWSWSTQLVAVDTNDNPDVFVRDLAAATTERISISSTGAQGEGYGLEAWAPVLSGDGRFAAFGCWYPQLVPGDTNSAMDVFLRDRTGASAMLRTYCTAKTNSVGCLPAISASGYPSASPGSEFWIRADQVRPQLSGLLFYGCNGPNETAFHDGVMCVRAPHHRTATQIAGAAGLPPCTGTYSTDFDLVIAAGGDPALVVGQPVWTQYWMRDPGSAAASGMSNGLTFVICP